jgi:hypothetical protein
LISDDLTGGSGYLCALAVSATGSDTIYSGSSNGKVYVTTDASTWNPRCTGLPSVPIPDVLIDPTDWQTAYVCADRSSSSRVYKTTDAGISWSDITGDLSTGLRAMSMTTDFSLSPPVLYLGTDYGVYYSTNGGTNWSKYGAYLPNVAVYEIGCDTANGLLVVATHGRGMWRTALFTPIEEETSTPIPSLGYMNISSNPVIGHAFDIIVNILHPRNFNVALFNISGQKVRAYSHKQLSAGIHRLTLSVDGLNSGVYFLKPGPTSEYKIMKLVIMK